jgi:hypothetical protein
MLGLDGHRLPGCRAGDVWVAIPVAADPRSQPDEGRYSRRLNPSRRAGQGGLCPPVDLWQRSKEHLVEHRHRGAYLVERSWSVSPQLRCSPEDVDFLKQPPAGFGLFGRAEAWIVAPLEEFGYPADSGDHGPAASLGRVGGKNRAELQVRE